MHGRSVTHCQPEKLSRQGREEVALQEELAQAGQVPNRAWKMLQKVAVQHELLQAACRNSLASAMGNMAGHHVQVHPAVCLGSNMKQWQPLSWVRWQQADTAHAKHVNYSHDISKGHVRSRHAMWLWQRRCADLSRLMRPPPHGTLASPLPLLTGTTHQAERGCGCTVPNASLNAFKSQKQSLQQSHNCHEPHGCSAVQNSRPWKSLTLVSLGSRLTAWWSLGSTTSLLAFPHEFLAVETER